LVQHATPATTSPSWISTAGPAPWPWPRRGQGRARAWHVFFAPANYHLLLEREGTLALSTDDKVHFSRPSIDVLFVSAAEALGPGAIGVVLTGASCDAPRAWRASRPGGGSPWSRTRPRAEYPVMPRAACAAVAADHVLPVSAWGRGSRCWSTARPARRDQIMPERQQVLMCDDRPENLVALEHVLGPLEVDLVKAGSGERR
jgi:hypothetical protein